MVHFPYEIWQEIALYLKDSGLLWRYQYLNSAMYNIALDLEHRTLRPCFEDLEPGKQWFEFWGFRNKDVARHVRSVEFRYQIDFYGRKPAWRIKSPGYIERKIGKLFNTNPEPYRDAVEVIKDFVNLSSISLRTSSSKLPQNTLSILNTTLTTWASSLTSLTLKTSLECLAKVLKPDIFFPRLTSLRIGPPFNRSSKHSGVIAREKAGVIVPFLNRHRLALTVLVLLVETDTNGSSPFIGLDRITSLTDFQIRIFASSEQSGRQHIRRFLEMLSSKLQTLCIGVNDSLSYHSISRTFKDITGPKFSGLQHLLISRSSEGYPPIAVEAWALFEIADFIHGFSASLVTLDLCTIQTMDTFHRLFHQEGTGNSYACLQSLYITFFSFTPEILDVLAARLPALQVLKISAEKLKPMQDAPDNLHYESQFCREMLQRDYSHWKLRQFILFTPGDGIPADVDLGDDVVNCGFPWDMANRFAKAAVAFSMPSLETFNRIPLRIYIARGPLAHLLG